MGIRGLTTWLKKAYPAAITKYPHRWASPEIRGKRIAIDATLMTNRFHFAVQDGPLEEKSSVLGWYHMVTAMRAHGVQPIAIWDERGVRDWKAPEARKRLAVRVLNLARLKHEEERSGRLTRLHGLVEEAGQLEEGQRLAIRDCWEATRFIQDASGSDAPLADPSLSSTPAAPVFTGNHTLSTEAKSATSSLATAAVSSTSALPTGSLAAAAAAGLPIVIINRLAAIVQEYRASSRPFARSKAPDPTEAIAEQLSSLSVESSSQPTEPLGDKVDSAALDFALRQNSTAYTESPLQTALTGAEGEIINRFLSQDIVARPMSAVKEIEALISEAPTVKSIYERALAVPSVEQHEECQELLRVMGVPVLEAKIPFEAEGLAASLALSGLADYVGTEDSDVLAYKAPLLRNLSSSSKPLELINGASIPKLASLSPEAYLDFVVLLGTDASPRIPGFGPVRAFRAIREHGSIEAVVANDPKARSAIVNHEAFFNLVKNAREVFGVPPPVPSSSELTIGKWDDQVIEAFMRERHGIALISEDERFNDLIESSRRH